MKLYLLLGAVAGMALLASQASHATSLDEAMAAAYASNPDLQAQQTEVRLADEEVARAMSGYRPDAGVESSITRQDIDSTLRVGPTRNENDYKTTDKAVGVEVNQPLFRGFRTRNSVRAAEAGVQAARSILDATEIALLLDVTRSYMDVVRDRAEVALNANQVQVLREQLKASRDRFTVGEITRTDVAQSEARLAVATANHVAAEGALAVSEESYRRIVGQAPESLSAPAVLPAVPESEEASVELALKANPQLLAARFAQQAARHGVDVAKGAILPSVFASAGVNHSTGNTLVGAATLGDSRRTIKRVGAVLTVPLYQSGVEYVDVRRAQHLDSQRRLEVAATERAVIESARNGWEQLRTARAAIVASRSAVRANEIALEGVRQEQMVGTRTTLDVLDAEQELLDTRVTLVRAERDEAVAAFGLLAATGQLTARELKLPVELYDPSAHYERTRGRWFGWERTENSPRSGRGKTGWQGKRQNRRWRKS